MEDVQVIELHDRERWIAVRRDGGLPSQSWQYANALSASGVVPKLAVVTSSSGRMLMPFHARQMMAALTSRRSNAYREHR
jgi:hypothetical protein